MRGGDEGPTANNYPTYQIGDGPYGRHSKENSCASYNTSHNECPDWLIVWNEPRSHDPTYNKPANA